MTFVAKYSFSHQERPTYNITTTKSIGKTSGKRIADTFCKSIDIGIADHFSRKYRYRYLQ